MGSRVDLQALLETYSDNVYFQAPTNASVTKNNESVGNLYSENKTTFISNRSKFPCILYSLSTPAVFHADGKKYHIREKYTVTYVTPDPDSEVPRQMLEEIPLCSKDRIFTSTNLYHHVFTIYF